ncbi:SGNH/GDSL hydrolase family protein [Staphylococcus agnetis]|uniref:SGNH/GDSL hydrolase family protein n=1 Tax=Staphylococcus agnetis TaxID=985762 RepID=UPI0021CEC719|nr:GDSL-type esterase/lipase family protein [Staphylococcus agnetis]UXU58990.1 GDSL-type esterase/lipase family protein [Staphylococcus agnetis]UXU61315.1 GDSL-type esterase/lipase family protein [Staphylococcus agnetis]
MYLHKIGNSLNARNKNNLNSNFLTIEQYLKVISDTILTNLNAQLTPEQFEQLQITLNDLVRKGDLSVSDINYNLGKIGLENLSDEVIKAIAGTADVNAIPKDYSIPIEKLMFTNKSVNLFNKNTITASTYINQTTGVAQPNATYSVSDYIPVEGGQTYTKNNAFIYYAFYDSSKTYISNSNTATQTITAPQSAAYIRFTFTKGTEGSTMFVKGASLPSTYEPYYIGIDGKYLDVSYSDIKGSLSGQDLTDESVTADKLSIMSRSENLFDKNAIVTGYYVNPSDGVLKENASWRASDYIQVKPNTQYYKTNTSNLYAYYDKSKAYITTSATSTNTFTTPSNASYVRVSVLPADLFKFMVVEGSAAPDSYESFYRFINPDYIDKSLIDRSYYGKFNLKTYTADFSKALDPSYNSRAEIAIIGDSWVQGGEFRAGDRLTVPLKDKLLKIYADGGIGFVGFANNHAGNGLQSVTLTGTWTEYDAHLDNGPQAKGLDTAMAESSTPGDTIKVQFFEDIGSYEIHTLNTGQWRYNIDGGDWVNVDATQQEVTNIPMDLGKHTINIEIVSGTVSFIGSYAYKGDNGVVVHKIGNGGLKASHIVSTDRANWVKQLQRCRANTFGILLGTNDMAQNVPIADYKRDMKEIISRIKEAKPYASIFLIGPSGNKYDGLQLHSLAEYSDAQYSIAKELDLAHVSLYYNLGDYKTTNANGLMYSDGVHPNKLGGYAISNVIYDRLLRLA